MVRAGVSSKLEDFFEFFDEYGRKDSYFTVEVSLELIYLYALLLSALTGENEESVCISLLNFIIDPWTPFYTYRLTRSPTIFLNIETPLISQDNRHSIHGFVSF